jgi:hypothetical protein
VPDAVAGAGGELPLAHPFTLVASPLQLALQLCVAAAPAIAGHQLTQSLCMELVLLFGAHIVPGYEDKHTQVSYPPD